MTKEQALSKLTLICSKGEYCRYDVEKKMTRWEIEPEVQEEIAEYLIREKYIDEERYARLFIKNKAKYNHWGIKKIEQALYAKHIAKDVYGDMLGEICKEDYRETLAALLENKKKNIKASSDYEMRGKLIRFALQRGFTYDQTIEAISRVKSEE